jgi:methyl-accepting chemotaxis protein
MKRKFKSILWRVVWLNLIALGATFALAYSAGRWSGGLSMLDFGALPSAAGFRLWAAALCAVIAILAVIWLAARVTHPLEQLVLFAQNLEVPEIDRPALPGTNDDFEEIAEQLRGASDRLAAAAAEQQRLTMLEERIAGFASEAQQLGHGDLALRVAGADGTLGEAFTSINAALDMIARVLDSARALAENGSASAHQSVACAQQVGKTLVQQQSQLDAATRAFDVLPMSIKQAQDSSEALARAAQSATTGIEQSRQSNKAASDEIQRVESSLRASGAGLAGVRQAADLVSTRLRALSTVTERANLLALNAAIESARAGQAGRSSWVFAEQFRELAEQSNAANHDLDDLMQSIHRDCAALAESLDSMARSARQGEQQAAQAGQAAEAGSNALSEALARADVIGIATARQADAVRAVSSSLQAGADLQQLAAQQTRQSAALAEDLVKLHAELNSALGVLRSLPTTAGKAKARAATADSQ